MATQKKTEISKEQYLQVVGLLAVGAAQKAAMNETDSALAKLLGVEDDNSGGGDPYHGHVSDAIWSGYTPKQLLNRLELTVRK